MSNLKDTDIDDLFRRASDKYPLRTDTSDWARMAAALEKDPPPGSDDDPDNSDRRKRRRFFWLFLLLPLGGAGYFVLNQTGHGNGAGQSPDAAVITHAAAGTDDSAAGQDHAATRPGSTTTRPGSTPASGIAQPATAATTPAGDNSNPSIAANAPAAATTSRPGAISASTHNRNRFAADHTNGGDAAYTQTAGSKAAGNSIIENTTTGNTTTDNSSPDNSFSNKSAPHSTNPVAAAFTLRSSNIDERLAPTTNPWRLAVDVKAPPKTVDSAKKNDAGAKRSRYFYAGVFAAPDFSTVKFQQMKGVGTTFGILLGYAFNDKWAIETGVYLDRKRYYTEGQYFDKEHVTVPRGSTLANVDGTCNMWEIPLNVRYTFNPTAKTKWFATAGLSTYLMTKEKYKDHYVWPTWSDDSLWTNKSPSQYPFSVINLSAGFEQRLGRVGSLRVEPYVRIPLGGIGTGKLPIMSAGVNIGITRRLWK